MPCGKVLLCRDIAVRTQTSYFAHIFHNISVDTAQREQIHCNHGWDCMLHSTYPQSTAMGSKVVAQVRPHRGYSVVEVGVRGVSGKKVGTRADSAFHFAYGLLYRL